MICPFRKRTTIEITEGGTVQVTEEAYMICYGKSCPHHIGSGDEEYCQRADAEAAGKLVTGNEN